MGYLGHTLPKLPSKEALHWRILRASLGPDLQTWRLTAVRDNRFSSIVFPEPRPGESEQEWYLRVDSEFDRYAYDPIQL